MINSCYNDTILGRNKLISELKHCFCEPLISCIICCAEQTGCVAKDTAFPCKIYKQSTTLHFQNETKNRFNPQ